MLPPAPGPIEHSRVAEECLPASKEAGISPCLSADTAPAKPDAARESSLNSDQPTLLHGCLQKRLCALMRRIVTRIFDER
jgi:hypothetical protein